LTLHASEETAPIEISLAEVRLMDAPKYDALSYTWATESGDDRRCRAVKCNDRRIKITKNCKRALCELRCHDKARLLWVDAVCIDQENDQERGHQVGIMRKIYSQANEVLIWLGEASEEIDTETRLLVSDLYLRSVTRMAAEMRELESKNKEPTSSSLYRQLLSDIGKMRLDKTKSSLLRGLLYVHSRPWWGRIWVLQEAAASKAAILMCSQQTARYSDVLYFHHILRRNSSSFIYLEKLLGVSRNHLSTLIRASKITDLNINLSSGFLRVLEHARLLKASDPRDRIFGLLGLSPAFARVLPAADYSRTPSDIFVEVAESVIIHSRSLLILTAIHDERSALDHPSWAPDWSRPALFSSIVAYVDYNASRKSKAVAKASGNSRELLLRGKEADSVREISLVASTWDNSSTTVRGSLTCWKSSCSLGMSLTEYPTGATILDSLWRTLCWNTDRHGLYPAPPENESYFKEWYDLLISDAKHLRKGSKFTDSVHLQKSPLCITASGLMASVPYTTEVGDRIMILSGSNVPFVLRPVKDHYRLIGPCYVHGIMDGEAWPKDENELEWLSIW
jgi:hypothetical protein